MQLLPAMLTLLATFSRATYTLDDLHPSTGSTATLRRLSAGTDTASAVADQRRLEAAAGLRP